MRVYVFVYSGLWIVEMILDRWASCIIRWPGQMSRHFVSCFCENGFSLLHSNRLIEYRLEASTMTFCSFRFHSFLLPSIHRPVNPSVRVIPSSKEPFRRMSGTRQHWMWLRFSYLDKRHTYKETNTRWQRRYIRIMLLRRNKCTGKNIMRQGHTYEETQRETATGRDA